MLDPVEFGKSVAIIVREANAPLLKRIEQLEARQPERGEPGPPGKDAEPIDAKEVVRELLAGPEVKTLVDLHVAEAMQTTTGEQKAEYAKRIAARVSAIIGTPVEINLH